MKKMLLIVTVSFMVNNIYGQGEKYAYKIIADKFETYYNGEKYDSIFGMFSAEMQKALPPDKTTAFLQELRSSSGIITKRQFIKYESSYASYKTSFERALYAVNISIDNDSKINGLFIKPFTEDNVPKPERNSTGLLLPFKEEWTVIWGGDTKN